MRVDKPLLPYKCKEVAWCPGGAPGTCARNRDRTKVGCAVCLEGAYTGNDGICHKCAGGEGPALISLGLAAGIGALAFLTFAVNKNVWLQPSSSMSCVMIL